ncbi:hypothetical protein EYZ11_012614 [Aspergillus tanneri]|uniref:Uncharacterized protein n=1 Tax=Aspergillus tanneri TaxID=1220188 RepID=A0A4S3IZS8_9EURO|nr:hypothetical protein EYZ11_012614 [Aspergillus tanneri]
MTKALEFGSAAQSAGTIKVAKFPDLFGI